MYIWKKIGDNRKDIVKNLRVRRKSVYNSWKNIWIAHKMSIWFDGKFFEIESMTNRYLLYR